MAGFPITQDQMEARLRDHGFITSATIESHLQEMAYIRSTAMRQFVSGELHNEHTALEQRLVQSVQGLHNRTAATQAEFETRVGAANATFD